MPLNLQVSQLLKIGQQPVQFTLGGRFYVEKPEGSFRVPTVVRWPGLIKPGTVFNGIVAHEDWIPTLLAAVGERDIKEKLKKGYQAGGKTFKVQKTGRQLRH